MQRIVITGLGVVSPIGNDVDEFKSNLFAGRGGIGFISFPFRGEQVRFPAAEVKNFKIEDYIDARKAALLDRFSQFAVGAAHQAFRDSGLSLTPEETERMGVIVGTGVGGMNTIEDSYHKLLDPAGPGRVHPFTIPRLMANAGASQISMTLGVTGPGFSVASACADWSSAISTMWSPRGVSEICSTRRSATLMRRVINPLSSRRQRSLEVRLSLTPRCPVSSLTLAGRLV